jgi:hypothetical protein
LIRQNSGIGGGDTGLTGPRAEGTIHQKGGIGAAWVKARSALCVNRLIHDEDTKVPVAVTGAEGDGCSSNFRLF